ncbi:hypothetical protein BN1708_004077 [Verticillium longisporum]|uniref:Aminoacyl-transfer RNA synthetases class-II family profile domain-containing protein n=1 Tax=Verticillium longisporum TaxID=100787 RepID=A0A0G4LWR5_VERLO|nr:hypothetical protein BN1708_004077 [Verticillium longisporum]
MLSISLETMAFRPGAALYSRLRFTPPNPRSFSSSCTTRSSVPTNALPSARPVRTVAQFLEWKPEAEATDVIVNGYVRSARTMKADVFVHIGDGSTRKPLQALVPRHMNGRSGLRVGAAVRLQGSWIPSKYATDQSHELKVDRVDILGASDSSTYPIQKKYQTPEYLRTIPHLRSRTPLNAAILRLRSDAVNALTRFFSSRDFTQTHPPIVTSSDCEGGGEVFNVSVQTPNSSTDDAPEKKRGTKNTTDTFFRGPRYLTVSTQLHLEALAQSVGNVWTLSPTFRAERSDTSRHMSEFYMLEAEMPFVDEMNDVLELVEDMLREVTTDMYRARAATELRERRVSSSASRTAEDDLAFYMRPTATSAQTAGTRDGPSSGANERGATVDCFDLLVPDLCEIAGGSMREHRLAELQEAMQARGMVNSSATPGFNGLDWYLDLRRWGSCPHGGFGLGFDRLLSYLAGVPNTRDVVAFPRWHGRCDC